LRYASACLELERGHFRILASLILVVNVVGKLQQKRTLAASRGFLAAARLSCLQMYDTDGWFWLYDSLIIPQIV